MTPLPPQALNRAASKTRGIVLPGVRHKRVISASTASQEAMKADPGIPGRLTKKATECNDDTPPNKHVKQKW